MAVAADFHRDFLIPEQYRHAVRPTTRGAFPRDELRLFFCVQQLYHIQVNISTPFAFLKKHENARATRS